MRYNLQHPEPIELPELEVGETLYDAICDWRRWMGLADDLDSVELVYDPAVLTVTEQTRTASAITFSVTAIGAIPAEQVSYQEPFQLRAHTVGGQIIGPVQYVATVIPSFGAGV